MSAPLVLVTGASGYIASHIIKQLLEQGYRVRGTVRSVKDENKIAPIRNLVENPKYQLELVEADLMNEQSWINAVKSCTYVLHTASPFVLTIPDDDNELITPAVNGTLFVLRACVQDGSAVQRVVLTSSFVAISGDNYVNDKAYSEADWADLSTCSAYSKSKTLAEKVAWDFIAERNKNKQPCFELAVINPGLVLGPQAMTTQGASYEIIKNLLEHQTPVVPDIRYCTCDVRNVALAHIRAMQRPEAVNHRHIISSRPYESGFQEYAAILDKEFRPLGYKVATTSLPTCAAKVLSVFNKQLKAVSGALGKSFKIDTKRMTDVLGVEPMRLEQTIVEMGHDLIKRNLVTKK